MRRSPRSRYHHLTSAQLIKMNRLLSDLPQADIVAAAHQVGLTPEQLKTAVWRWRWDRYLAEHRPMEVS